MNKPRMGSLTLEEKYHELLYAVITKYPDETRHETALRYIQEAEQKSISVIASDSPESEETQE